MDRLEVRQLEYVVTLAEELHFARAAERLGIASPPLSRAISRLERQLGVTLFERTSRRVELTPAGARFVPDAYAALGAVDRAVERVRAAQGILRVAAAPGTGSGLLRELHRRYEVRHGQGSIDVVFTRRQAVAVREGKADVALLCASEDVDRLDSADVGVENPVALVPASHRWATRSRLTPQLLYRDPSYRPVCPRVGVDELVERVALGRLVVLVGDSVVERLGPAVRAIPVTGLAPSELLLAWPADSHDPRIADLLDLARRLGVDAAPASSRAMPRAAAG
jgi:DNA-binding transcriptional LysR family regulator